MSAKTPALTRALALGLGLLAAMPAAVVAEPAPASPPYTGEPLPAGAPKEEYELTAWCYGAMAEYLDVYDIVKPSLRDIDKQFGSSVPGEKEPYAADMAAARTELKVLASAVTAAEKASPSPIAPQGVEAVRQGRAIWSVAEQKSRRELARAWLSWAIPDKCDSTARQLASKSALLGQALKYNSDAATPEVSSGSPPPPATDQGNTTPPPTADSPSATVPETPAAPPPSETPPPSPSPSL